jgi:hypothetical protein
MVTWNFVMTIINLILRKALYSEYAEGSYEDVNFTELRV